MRSKGHFTIITALVVGLATLALAGPKVNYSENVTATILDTDASGTRALLRSDDSNDVGEATYSASLTTEDGYPGVFDLVFTSTRGVWVTPNEPINSAQPVAPPANFYYQGKINTACKDASGNVVPLELVVNGSGTCSLGIDFFYNGTEYKLLMSPSGVPPLGASCPSGGCPATGLAQVSCNQVSSGNCVNWTITPNTAAANPTVATLFQATGNKSALWAYVGQYYSTFRVNVTHP